MKHILAILMAIYTLAAECQQTEVKQQIPDEAFEIIKPVTQEFSRLMSGQIKPSGWLKAQMQRDMDGFIGQLDKLVPELMNDSIYGSDRLTKFHKSKDLGNTGQAMDPQYLWWNSETQSNWRDGYIRTAILLNDLQHLDKARHYIEYLLSTQDEDGYLGIYAPELRYKFQDENGELWAKASALRGVLAWYEYTGDAAILESVKRAVADIMRNYPRGASSPFRSAKPFAGGLTHGLVITDVLDQLYQLTGNRGYLDYALFLYKDFSLNVLAEDAQLGKILDPEYRNKEHGVHTYEHLRPLTMAWMASGNSLLKEALDIYLKRIDQCSTPSGGPIGDEWVGGRHADATHTGYEYCSIQELLDGYTGLLQKTGDPSFGDLAERLFYNAAQGARHPDESAIAYCKTDNSYAMTGTLNGEVPGNEAQNRFKYSPAHQDVAVCCVPNAGRIAPYFVQSMWMKDDQGLIAALPGPCEVRTTFRGVGIVINEITDYPFSNAITFGVEVEKPVDFVLKVRKPSWADTIVANTEYTIADGYINISKKWAGRQIINIEMPAEPRLNTSRKKEQFFSFGPLLFAVPLESREIIMKDHPVHGFRDLGYEPASQARYRVPVSGKPEIRLLKNESASGIWKSLELTTLLVNESTGKKEQVSLRPVGGTILRQLTLPYEVQTATGRIVRYSNLASKYVNARNVDVWLPEHYDSSRKYSVIYMHDGQMLFDSTINWNRQEWGVDETIGRLMAEKKLKECIVVGIWNTEKRHQEYFPQKPFESMTAAQRAHVEAELQNLGRTTNAYEPVSDNYLKFLVMELKPMIDQSFSTLTGREDTFIAGSSMGGLISVYAICEYPDVFGGAACLSTHWPGIFSLENNPCPEAFFGYLKNKLPDPATHLLYFDYGDQTLDALYPPLQKRADEIIKAAGFAAGNWQTRFFPGDDHSENSWKRRFEIPALFLLGL